jgi:hypothetical protein
MIFGVDGTGPFFNRDYETAMRGSFVNQLCGPPKIGARYWRGPDAIDTFMGGPAPRVVAEAIRYAVVPNAAQPQVISTGLGPPAILYPTSKEPLTNLTDKVYLTGYSRGGATVLDVALILKNYGIPVEAIFLFDAVTRSPWLSGEVIPANVKHCYHAIREPKSGSRRSFGNSRAVAAAGVKYYPEYFLTTHAGMGGVPWGQAGLVKPAAVPLYPPAGQPVWPPVGQGFGHGATIVTPGQVAAEMVRANPGEYADKIYEGAPDWAFTTVTVAQEKLGMDAVRVWMWEHVHRHGLAG